MYECCVMCAALGGARGDARGVVTRGAVLYTEGRPRSTGGASPALPRSRQLESKTGGSNATKHGNRAATAGKLTLSEMRRWNASFNYC